MSARVDLIVSYIRLQNEVGPDVFVWVAELSSAIQF
jgi:hypothetical protein